MYIPKKFLEEDRATLYEIISRYDFGFLVGEIDDGPVATHLPFQLEGDVLVSHMARANPHWECFAAGKEVLAIFQGPHCYVSPRWYESTPAVPTWNYVAVHGYGVPEIIESLDAAKDCQAALVDHYEQGAWHLKDLPDDYVTGMSRAIVSFRIPISRVEGKFKLSQNRTAEDRRRVIAELEKSDDPLARDVAALMIRREC